MYWTQIHCDGCMTHLDAVGGRNMPAHKMRTRLKKLGWRVDLPKGEDLCPQCSQYKKKQSDVAEP